MLSNILKFCNSNTFVINNKYKRTHEFEKQCWQHLVHTDECQCMRNVMYVDKQGMLSDESEDEGAAESHEELTYRRKYQMLLERCEVLQQDNERLVHRIQQVYKYTRQVRKERKFLMDRLDKYGDNWRQGITQYIHEDGLSHSRLVTKQKHIPHNMEKQSRKSSVSNKKSLKEKTEPDTRKNSKDLNKTMSKNMSGFNFLP